MNIKSLTDKALLESTETLARKEREILARHVPRAPKPDRMKPVTENAWEVCFQGSPELQEKVEILRGLLAYKHPNLSLGELFEKLCDLGIEAWDPGRPPKRARRSVPQVAESPAAQQVEAQPPHRHRPLQPKSPAAPRVNASLRRLIWQKARNRRENCHSRHALEIDHRIHRAHGGTNTPENLRLLCRSCNQRAAIQTLGLKKIEPHLDRKN